ncbi:phage tail tube protein [Caldanaerobacter subterraneus]|uniref:Phage tail tube protein n=1 Tax=Caldanaerobacter subterraneus TaxID=911092 RepID=A0A7Y2PKU1_9THEO|nr:phage tail tube protein [Caldanaerobacter subterraneus]NNG67344.1 phage tail tube protein [Caldanaerobacter subterraneus]
MALQGYKAEQVINGTFGEVWINGEYVAEVTGLEAKVTLEKSEVNIVGKLSKGYKVTGYEGKGTLKLNKVTSRFIKLMNDNMKQGKQTVCTIVSKLADPNALGAERIVIKDATFDELTLANWEARKLTEESVPFTFTDWDVLDTINA